MGADRAYNLAYYAANKRRIRARQTGTTRSVHTRAEILQDFEQFCAEQEARIELKIARTHYEHDEDDTDSAKVMLRTDQYDLEVRR